ncbi:hypothetical protein Xszus_01332 [Xenorhabdus szentirmaii]|uniref:Uncharacterized protein n=2 Tax=Xenorhabdus TaxID=626 RepID=W1J1B9_9GAMM|nr:hypothetical protein Xsze_02798 [Xenorhabdus szentirmaii DSM 16338]PHM41638.1 hypothetical protein Xszus_01332 [Xenorhabdus szentirmaii]CDL83873.1 hypothetical protein XSR1_380036 [Xenorhabdus szentirmaii DSM 16338]
MNATLNLLSFRELVNYQIYYWLVQPFGSTPSLSNSLRPNVFNQLPKVIPASDAASSNCAFNSGVILIWKVGDKPFPFSVLSLFKIDMYVRNLIACDLLCTYFITVYVQKETPPNDIDRIKRGLTTNDNYNIEVAMFQYTFLTGKGKARLPKFFPMYLISILEVSHV